MYVSCMYMKILEVYLRHLLFRRIPPNACSGTFLERDQLYSFALTVRRLYSTSCDVPRNRVWVLQFSDGKGSGLVHENTYKDGEIYLRGLVDSLL